MITVTLFNRHAQCGIQASGRYPLAAMRLALKKAGPTFLNYRGDHSDLNGAEEYAVLYGRIMLEMGKKRRYTSVYHPAGALGVEVRRDDR